MGSLHTCLGPAACPGDLRCCTDSPAGQDLRQRPGCMQQLNPEPPTLNPEGCVQDLAKDSAPHYKAARKLFDALALQMSGQAHALDVFACSLDQVCICLGFKA